MAVRADRRQSLDIFARQPKLLDEVSHYLELIPPPAHDIPPPNPNIPEGVIAVMPAAKVREVIGLLCKAKIHRIYVVDANGRLCGVISLVDILRYFRPRAANAAT